MKERNTLQKRLVLEAARSLFHPTADDVYHQVIKDHPHVSRGTIYRILGQMAEQNILRRVMVPGAADRFDITLCDHYHVQCRVCGRVEDAPLPYQPDILKHVVDSGGFRIEGHDILLRGVCSECLEKNHTPRHEKVG